jgi:hypothetical protein
MLVFEPGQYLITSVLTITPPANLTELPVDGAPIADIPVFVNGELIGGIRKVWQPAVPLGDPQEPSYAESEIAINPDPSVAGQPTIFTTKVRNNSDYPQTITIQFSWADFGVGIPFTNTNVIPEHNTLTLGQHMTATVSAEWTPPHSGDFCVQAILDNEETGEELHSQHNIYVFKVPEVPCESFVKEFELQNSTPDIVTVTIGANAINLPPGWTYSVDPTEAVLAPYESIAVTVVITPPCELDTPGWISGLTADGNLSRPKLRVEGCDQNGTLIGGIELEFVSAVQHPVFLPLVFGSNSMGTGGDTPSQTFFLTVGWLPKSWTDSSICSIILLAGEAGIFTKHAHS